jgi:hypothetical protein
MAYTESLGLLRTLPADDVAIDQTLARDRGLAGVGGVVSEPDVVNEEYEQRRKRHSPDRHIGRVTRLDSGGLYRRAAIESIGYLTDRNLHGAEEFDLGARLHSAGWTLIKLDQPIVHHEPHTGSAYRLLLRRIFNRNAWAPGELIRAAMAKRYFWFVLRLVDRVAHNSSVARAPFRACRRRDPAVSIRRHVPALAIVQARPLFRRSG